ncbi:MULTISPECIES: hypothetical protein [Vibrio]|jgi:hypothetical protein|uniref:Uncharacterized protein n=1 Tax=Vibrio coralliilyticus TaxID=190893 RepID=A0AAP6ZLM6_9VIBR|nr:MULTISPECIES: hypothetical protein [Vibrio]ANW26481.1 hypothetical protein BA953_20205 [Vibrio coralliilyticus]ARC93902.1 hypothetical protein B6A42_19640 [Vibrio coralliilyticus]EEX32867.1 hypothetical protein VIC_002317 [Vibrio coralliilyticus ATCC BAA-450]ERB65716.1 hypothetical protein N779_08475 [Vibrio coralliilyticus OCN008]KFI13219.1 hypothetical protein IX95_04540 [Vibrio sp. B183]
MTESIDNIIEQITSQIEDSPIKNLLTSALTVTLDKQKATLQELIEARNNGDLTNEDFELEILREKQIAEAEMLTWQISAKSEVQKIVNKTFSTLVDTLV